MRTLISWLAYNNDFLSGKDDGDSTETSMLDRRKKPTRVNRFGPTIGFHEKFYKGYDRHILLSQEKVQDDRLDMLTKELANAFPRHVIETRLMAVRDIIDVGEITTKVDALITSLPDEEEIELFISPGTPAMQTAWYLLQMSTKRARRVLQSKRNPETNQQELFEVSIGVSSTPGKAIVFNKDISNQLFGSDFLMTEALDATYHRAILAGKAHNVPVLILGETGTGKEHLAKIIHEYSDRKDHIFKAINCGALAESMLETVLFGFKKGAFAGAKKDAIGLFEATNGGTIFLDEIGDISPKMQLSLLRVLEESKVLPIGATEAKEVKVRVVAATNQDLRRLCAEGKFRWDLYYRLAVIELQLPALRDWSPKDRRKLLMHTINRLSERYGEMKELEFDQDAMDAILSYRFPGNIREMQNLIQRLLVFADGNVTKAHLPIFIQEPEPEYSFRWKDAEKAHIEKVLKFTRGNKRQAMKLLEYGSPNTLTSKIKEYKIDLQE